MTQVGYRQVCSARDIIQRIVADGQATTYPKMTAFHIMMLSSFGAPVTPCGGSFCRRRKSRISLRRAGVDIVTHAAHGPFSTKSVAAEQWWDWGGAVPGPRADAAALKSVRPIHCAALQFRAGCAGHRAV